MLKAQDLNELVTQANGYVHEVDAKKPDTVDISNYISEGDELPLGCYYVYYGNPTHTLAGRYTYTDTYFIAICISHWEHAHTLAIYTKNAQNKYIYYETFRTDQASTAMERYIASLFAGAPATYQQDGLMSASDKQAFDKLQESISEETTQSEAEEFRFETDGGTLIGKIDSTGADFFNLKRNGYQVATVAQIPGIDTSIDDSPSQIKVPTTKAVKDYVDANSGGGYPIDTETTSSEAEEQVWGDDAETQEYAKIGSYGMKSKAYLDMHGNSVIPTKDTSIGDSPSLTNVPTSKAVADYVEAHCGGTGDLPISGQSTESEDEDFFIGNDNGSQTYMKVGSYGIKAKAYLDMSGNQVTDNNMQYQRICDRNSMYEIDRRNPFLWKKFDKAYFSWTNDDARKADMHLYQALCEEFNFPYCPAVPWEAVNAQSYLINGIELVSRCQTIVENGGEILMHGNEVLTLTNSENDFVRIMRDGKKIIEDKVGCSVNGYIVIGGTKADGTSWDNSAAIRNLGQKYGLNYYQYSDKLGETDQYKITRLRYEISENRTEEEAYQLYVAAIDDAVTNHKWLRLYCHGESEVPITLLRRIFTYIQGKIQNGDADFVNWKYMYDTFGGSTLDKVINPTSYNS